MEAGRLARQLGRSEFTVMNCWDQWTEETSFTWRPGSGHPRQVSRRGDRHIIRHAHVEPIASLDVVQIQAAPALQASVSSRTIASHLAEGYLISLRPFTCAANNTHPPTPPFGVVPRTTGLDCNGIEPGRIQRRM
ncbi:transposable element Tcb2 transposase [Trichonephila clavipes]|uniref:Transposable element Tcb2 transposase n=1 Tax=Trichonephila clavipes TaxID=2585209 RepID=A0A8X6UZJ7_TRICX|nr:transposable element Tcb2 transposase [Trichonephila clavipes]